MHLDSFLSLHWHQLSVQVLVGDLYLIAIFHVNGVILENTPMVRPVQKSGMGMILTHLIIFNRIDPAFENGK